jgi:hypothetical protein
VRSRLYGDNIKENLNIRDIVWIGFVSQVTYQQRALNDKKEHLGHMKGGEFPRKTVTNVFSARPLLHDIEITLCSDTPQLNHQFLNL